MNSINHEEIYNFADELKKRNITVLFEIEENKKEPMVMFYKIPNGFWTGIFFCIGEESINGENYCGTVFVEHSGAIDIGLFTIHIKENEEWKYLSINDFEKYNQTFIENAIYWYNAAKENGVYPTIGKKYPSYNMEVDIKLKDVYMELYIKQHKAAGNKFVYH